MRRALVLASLLTAIASIERPAHADEPAGVQPSSRHDVAVNATGSPDEVKLLDETLRELLGRLGLRVVPGDAAGPSVLARVDVDLTGVAITVVDARDGATVAQRSLARDGSSALVCEETAHAIRAMVASELLDPEKVEKRKATPPPPPPPVADKPLEPAPPVVAKEAEEPKTPAGWGVDIATFVAVGPYADQKTLVPRFGIGGGIGSRHGLRPSVAVALQYALPFETSGEVGAHASVIAPRLLGSIEVLRTSWMALGAGAGGGVDVISVEPRSAVLPSSTLRAETSRVDPILAAAVTAQFPLVPGVVFTTAIGADVDLASRAYVSEVGTQRTDVLVPWRVRPAVALGFAFTALGEATFR